jgi:hypothetical protein
MQPKRKREDSMSLLSEIISGTHDAELGSLSDAIHERKKLKRSQETATAMATIRVGDVVVLKNLRPKYINGLKGKVVSKARSKISVRLNDGQNTGRFGQSVTCPASCLDKV